MPEKKDLFNNIVGTYLQHLNDLDLDEKVREAGRFWPIFTWVCSYLPYHSLLWHAKRLSLYITVRLFLFKLPTLHCIYICSPHFASFAPTHKAYSMPHHNANQIKSNLDYRNWVTQFLLSVHHCTQQNPYQNPFHSCLYPQARIISSVLKYLVLMPLPLSCTWSSLFEGPAMFTSFPCYALWNFENIYTRKQKNNS